MVLVYMGYLNAVEMTDRDRTFGSHEEWKAVLGCHADGIVDRRSWDEWIDIGGVPMILVIRSCDQPYELGLH